MTLYVGLGFMILICYTNYLRRKEAEAIVEGGLSRHIYAACCSVIYFYHLSSIPEE